MKIVNRLQEAVMLFNLSRVLLLICLILLLYSSLSTLAVVSLFPLKEVKPYLIQLTDKSEQIVNIEPIAVNTHGLEKLKEKMTRQYVISRETIDLHTDISRWQKLVHFHDEDIEQSFSNIMNPEEKNSKYGAYLESKQTRWVKILSSVSLAPTAPDIYIVEWISEDIQNHHVLSTQTFISKITVAIEPKTLSLDDELLNPIGFTVTAYTVSKKEEHRK